MDINNKESIIENITAEKPLRIVMSKPVKNAAYKKINIARSKNGYRAEMFTDKQAFHENLTEDGILRFINERLEEYMQINAWTDGLEHIILISKKGKVSYKKKSSETEKKVLTSHNRKKKYIIEEGTIVPPLVDMGIFTKDGKIVHSMYEKFR